jgi:lipid-A-disaccharide synthase
MPPLGTLLPFYTSLYSHNLKYYIISGEPSGDLHASNMMKELLVLDPTIQFRFWGGDLMEKVAREKPVKHIKDLAFMGFVEVAKNIRTIFKNIAFCKEDILSFKPDVLILVDYPGFNLLIAQNNKAFVFCIISRQPFGHGKKTVLKL